MRPRELHQPVWGHEWVLVHTLLEDVALGMFSALTTHHGFVQDPKKRSPCLLGANPFLPQYSSACCQ